MKHLLLLLTLLSSTHLVAGGLDREIYTDILGNNLSTLKNSPKFLVAPDFFDVVTEYESPQNYGSNYGATLRGYLTIPEDGDYTFYLASDDQGDFFLSTDNLESSKVLMASLSSWTSYRQFDKYDSQTSVTLSLTAGQVLYTESNVKEGGGLDHLSVAWSINGGPIEVISGDHLTPYFADAEKFKTELAVSLATATALYDESALTIGTEMGQYSEASRLNFATALATLEAVHDSELSDSRSFYSANIQTLAAIDFFTGGVKPVKLTGEIFGATPSQSLTRTPKEAFDGDIGSFYQYFAPDDGYVGIDLGAGNETALSSVRYHPLSSHLNRLKGNKFQGSLDNITYIDLYTITDEGAGEWTTAEITDVTAYRYYRYLDIAGSNDWGVIAEVEFYGLVEQELRMQKHEVLTLAGETENQIITSEKLTAVHGGLLPQFITYEVLTLPTKGTLALGAVPVALGTTFTQVDLNNNLVTYSSDASRLADNFSVKVADSIGGLLEEVIIDIMIDTDGDGLSDSQEISLGTDLSNADTDGDGMSDSWENENGFNPIESESSPLLESINGENGLIASYNFGAFTSLKDFRTRAPAKVSKISSINFPSYYSSEFANSGVKDYVGARFTGYLYIPIAGEYKFAITSDDGSSLYIDGAQILNNDGLHGARTVGNSISLTAGLHKIRCEYFEKTGSQVCILQWQGPSRPLEVIPSSFFFLSLDEYNDEVTAIDQDQDGLTDLLEAVEGSDPLNPDTDGDRLLDGEEYHATYNYRTLTQSVDTDGDLATDFEEIFIYKSNPLIADFDGTSITMLSIKPSEYFQKFGLTEKIGDSVRHISKNALLTYKPVIEVPGMYLVNLSVSQYLENADRNDFELAFFIDDMYVGKENFKVVHGEETSVKVVTPFLGTGTHTLKVFINNFQLNTSLIINEIILSLPTPAGDGDTNWQVNRLHNMVGITNKIESSKISPACIEGNGRYLSLMSTSDGSKLKRGTLNHWYSDVALVENGVKEFILSYQSGLFSETLNIVWEETNVLADQDMIIRKGDSLLFNAISGLEDSGIQSSSVTIEGEIYEIDQDNGYAYKFDTVGTFTISATQLTNDGVETNGSIEITIVEAPVTQPLHIWEYRERVVTWPELNESLILDGDGLELEKIEDASYGITRYESFEDINIVTRIKSNGLILSHTVTQPFWLDELVEGYVYDYKQISEGVWQVTDTVFLSPFAPEDIKVTIKAFVSGVTFEDGTTQKVLTKNDFSFMGEYKLVFFKDSTRLGAACHRIEVYQENDFVGKRK